MHSFDERRLRAKIDNGERHSSLLEVVRGLRWTGKSDQPTLPEYRSGRPLFHVAGGPLDQKWDGAAVDDRRVRVDAEQTRIGILQGEP